MQFTLVIGLDDKEVQDEITRLLQAGRDWTPVMRQIANHLLGSVQHAFRSQADPATGEAWKPLSRYTISQRKKKGKGPTPILVDSGALRGSLTAKHDADTALAGTNILYAAVHQYGAKKGQILPTGERAFGDIPARPFLGLRHQERNKIITAIIAHLRGRR